MTADSKIEACNMAEKHQLSCLLTVGLLLG